MRFTQVALFAMASVATAQDLSTETVLTVTEVPSASDLTNVIPTPTGGNVVSEITSAIGDATEAASSLLEDASSLIEDLSSAVSESIVQSQSAELSSRLDAIETETNSEAIASHSSAIADITNTDDGNFAARPTGAIAAGALLGGAAILANL